MRDSGHASSGKIVSKRPSLSLEERLIMINIAYGCNDRDTCSDLIEELYNIFDQHYELFP